MKQRTPRMPSSVWQLAGTSARGSSHVRRGTPNQDAVDWRQPRSAGSPAILAIADGHGHQRYLRSHNGSKIAVQVAIQVLHDFHREHAESDLSAVKRAAEDRLPRRLVDAWRQRVSEHLGRLPLSEDELQKLTALEANHHLGRLLENPISLYGSTVIAALLTARYMLFLQLGDGDILTVADDGQVARPPLAHDPRLLANQTTSLGTSDAWTDIRLHFQSLADRPPALILLATDGYANSFADEAGFHAMGADLLALIREDGLHAVQRRLHNWLSVTSQQGSGDDITLGLAYLTEDTR